MRGKIARKVRKNLLRTGAIILKEGKIAEKGWRRKDCGYKCDFKLNGKECWCVDRDPLRTYRMALEVAEEIMNGELEF